MREFTTQMPVRFGDVDGGGIVFYPRYIEMAHRAFEDWFDQALGLSFGAMHENHKNGVPQVELNCRYHRPSKLGEMLTFAVALTHIGRSSFSPRIRVLGADQSLRLELNATHVFVAGDGQGGYDAAPIPAAIRARMAPFLTAEAGGAVEKLSC